MVLNSNDAGTDKLAIAEQVIVSAGDILVAAGFQRQEIASFFRQAADVLTSGEAAGADAPDRSQRSAPVATPGADIRSNFRNLAAVRALAAQMATAEAIRPPHQGTAALAAGFDLAMAMLPHIAEAQNWLREAAAEAGLAIVANRHTRLNSAPVEDLAQEGETLFLDDCEVVYTRNFEWITDVTKALLRQGNEKEFSALLIGLVENNISPTHDLKDAMEVAVQSFACAVK